ncbi:MAG: DUF4397 domain-containing protein [Terracidiphilus sp.]
MKTTILTGWIERWMNASRPPAMPRLFAVAAASLAVALVLSACQTVATYTQPSLVRVIDASYIAPAINVQVEGQLLASNIGQGAITPYGTLAANAEAPIDVTAATGGAVLVTTSGSLLAGNQHSVLITDNGAAPNGYLVTILEDQQIQAAEGHSAFRFLNQAAKTGAVDIYMMPAGATLANTVPLVTNLPVGATAGYISFISQTVTMVVTPTGLTTPQYAFSPITLTGGEVRTVLLMDTQLTSNPAVEFTIADDAGPAN